MKKKKEKKRKNFAVDKFQKRLGKDIFIKKEKKENSDILINREINTIVNDKFYNNENSSNNEKNKNTTATENKKNNKKEISDENNALNCKDKKQINNEGVLVSKTPIKIICKSEDFKEEENKNENLEVNGIRKNLGVLFNQHAGI